MVKKIRLTNLGKGNYSCNRFIFLKMIYRSTNKLSHINSCKTDMFAYIVLVDIKYLCDNFCEYRRDIFIHT